MIDCSYALEGERIGLGENSRRIKSLAGLECALAKGETVEGIALRCHNDMTLEFDLGGIKGIMPKEEVSFTPTGEPVKDIAAITRVGKPVCFKVINIYEENGVVTAALSRRAAQAECVRDYLMDLIPGDVIPARVTHIEQFGVFVDVGCGVCALLPIDAISVSRISHPADRFDVGMNIWCVVKSIDYEKGRLFLSHKELLGSWEENSREFSVGQTVAGTVRSVENYGIFVELAPNLAGLCEYRDGVCPGERASVYIKNIIPEKMKVKLVLIDSCRADERISLHKYYIDTNTCSHIDRWRYSPACCSRIIESVFV